jgi:hypothetical protein
MIFIVTNRDDFTADFLIIELRRRKVDYFRFNTEDFPLFVNISWQKNHNEIFGKFEFANRIINFDDITSVWYRRPVLPNLSTLLNQEEEKIFCLEETKSFLFGVWQSLDCFWVSNPISLLQSENKLFQLRIAGQIGFEIWPTLITNSSVEVQKFYKLQKKIVYKTIRRGRINRESNPGLIFTNQIQPEHIEYFDKIKYAPGIFQKLIPKAVEIRVTIVGIKVFAVEIQSQLNQKTLIDWRRVNSDTLIHKIHDLPINIQILCINLVKALGLQFGAIDLILTPEGHYVFLEINPNGQWAWIQQLCPEIPLRESIVDLLLRY